MPERSEDQWRLSQILAQQAQAAFVAGDYIALQASAKEGREIADAIGDRFGSRQCGWRLAAAQVIMGDLAEGSPYCGRWSTEAEAEHDVISRVTALLILPQALAYQGDADAARTAAEGAIEFRHGTRRGLHRCRVHRLMIANLAAGAVGRASESADTAWTHLRSLEGTAQLNSGLIAQAALACGDLADARTMGGRCHRGVVRLESGVGINYPCPHRDRRRRPGTSWAGRP